MSDKAIGDDVFDGPDDAAPVISQDAPPELPVAEGEGAPSPVASGSRGGSVIGAGSPGLAKEEDGNDSDDLFGDDDDDDDKEPKTEDQDNNSTAERQRRIASSPSTAASAPRSRSRSRSASRAAGSSRSGTPGTPADPLEYPEEEGDAVEERAETWVTLALPKREKMESTDGKIWHLRLPAYVNIESQPYDPNLYRATLPEPPENETNVEKRSRMIGVRNTVRWRWVSGPDGEEVRQSNSRLLRWSDGSMSLQLGSDLYDLQPSYGTTLAREEDLARLAAEAESKTNGKPNAKVAADKDKLPAEPPGKDTTFLVTAAPEEQVLVTETAIAGQLSLVPTSMTSKTHMEIVKHVGRQHVKHSRMKLIDELHDPEKAQAMLQKAAGMKVKRRPAGSGSGGGGGLKLGGAGTGRGGGRSARKKGSDDDEGYDDVMPSRGRRDEGDYDEDDGFVVADDDDDDEGGNRSEESEEEDGDATYGRSSKSKSKSGSKSKSSSKANGKKRRERREREEEDLDEMEEAERRIEEQERERKRARRESGRDKDKEGKKEKARKSRDYVDTEDEEEEDEEEGRGGREKRKDEDDDEDEEEEDAEGEEDMDMDVESEED